MHFPTAATITLAAFAAAAPPPSSAGDGASTTCQAEASLHAHPTKIEWDQTYSIAPGSTTWTDNHPTHGVHHDHDHSTTKLSHRPWPTWSSFLGTRNKVTAREEVATTTLNIRINHGLHAHHVSDRVVMTIPTAAAAAGGRNATSRSARVPLRSNGTYLMSFPTPPAQDSVALAHGPEARITPAPFPLPLEERGDTVTMQCDAEHPRCTEDTRVFIVTTFLLPGQ